jgi:hypothetical protein
METSATTPCTAAQDQAWLIAEEALERIYTELADELPEMTVMYCLQALPVHGKPDVAIMISTEKCLVALMRDPRGRVWLTRSPANTPSGEALQIDSEHCPERLTAFCLDALAGALPASTKTSWAFI